MNIMIPKRELLSGLPPASKLKKDKLMYLLHILIINSTQEKNCYEDKKTGLTYVRLNAKILKNVLGNRYKKYLDYWVDLGVVVGVDKYSRGNYSKSYALTTKYNQDFDWYTITDYVFKKALTKSEIDQNAYPFLRTWIDNLKIDKAGATIKAEALKPLTLRKRKSLQYAKYSRCKLNIENFNEKTTLFKVDDKGFRLHTKLTGCNKVLREYITFENQDLVEVDMSNSQFYFFLYLMDRNVWRKTQELRNLFKSYQEYILPKFTSIMFTIIDRIHISGEFEEYKKLVSEGKIYDHFLELFKKQRPDTTRDGVKKLMIIAQFSMNRKRISMMKTLFKSRFPNIYQLTCSIKGNTNSSQEKKHPILAVLLQRIESELILNRVCTHIKKERPDLPMFTIHDCLVTTAGNESYVDAILRDECFKLVGVFPTTKTKPWQPQESKVISIPIGNMQAA